MKAAGAAMERIHNGMTIEKVDEAMEKLRDQQELNNEIAEAITRPALGDQVDEDDLEQELEGLEQEAMDERMLNTGTVPVADQLNRLPATTTADPSKAKQTEEEDEEAELAKLRAEMAM
jgi:charged multivesicular body protein 4